MPRLPPSLIRRAHSISPHLAALLPACRDLNSARNELRWIREHVSDLVTQARDSPSRRASRTGPLEGYANRLLARLCRRRGAGVPLQYVLGSQPFAHLDIRCRPGILIPRPETEAWAAHLAGVVAGRRGNGSEKGNGDGGGAEKSLRVLDLCTGTGCIALLLYSLLRRRFPRRGLCVKGLDVEPRAVALARQNLVDNARRGLLGPGAEQIDEVVFGRADIFASDWLAPLQLPRDGNGDDVGQGPEAEMDAAVVDILVSNPPYISAAGFARDTERSVRNYEPRLALVPSARPPPLDDCEPEDVFYARLLEVAAALRPEYAVFEVGDLAQACRVVRMARRGRFASEGEIEIWRDWPDMRPSEDEAESVEFGGVGVPVRGSGHGRAVFIRRAS
ncbi:hypothetical protein AAE478_004598 [Parahypoxylon ruwenzoriense]